MLASQPSNKHVLCTPVLPLCAAGAAWRRRPTCACMRWSRRCTMPRRRRRQRGATTAQVGRSASCLAGTPAHGIPCANCCRPPQRLPPLLDRWLATQGAHKRAQAQLCCLLQCLPSSGRAATAPLVLLAAHPGLHQGSHWLNTKKLPVGLQRIALSCRACSGCCGGPSLSLPIRTVFPMCLAILQQARPSLAAAVVPGRHVGVGRSHSQHASLAVRRPLLLTCLPALALRPPLLSSAPSVLVPHRPHHASRARTAGARHRGLRSCRHCCKQHSS